MIERYSQLPGRAARLPGDDAAHQSTRSRWSACRASRSSNSASLPRPLSAVVSLFAGYANGYFGYFPTIRAAVEGGYGAEGLVARTEVGAGESMLDTGLIRLHTMLGQLKPLPQR